MSAAALRRVKAWLGDTLPDLLRYEYERGRMALDLRALVALAERAAELERRVRQYAKALRISRALTGWSTQSDVDAQIRAALSPRPKPGTARRGRR